MNQGEGTTAHNARAGQLVDFLSPKGLGSLHTLGKDLQEASARLLVASNQLASKHMGTGKSYFSPQANQFTTALEARYLSSDLSPGFEPILSGEGLASASRWMDLQFTAPEFASFPFAREVLRLQNPSPEIGDALAESRTVRQSLFAKLKRTNVVRRMHALGVDGAAPSEEPASFEQTLSTLLELSSEMQDLDTGSMELAGTQQTRPYPSRLGGAGRRFIPASHGASAGHLLRSLRHDPIHGKDYSPEALAGLPSLLQQSIGGGETNGFRPGPAITHLALSNAGRKNAAGPQAQDTAPWVGMDGFSGTFVELLKETGTSSPTEAGSPPGPPATGLRALLQRTIRGAGGQPAVTSFPLPAIAQGPEGITPALAALALQGESGEAGSQASASSAHVLEALLTQRGSGAGLRELQFATHIAAQHGELTGASGAPYAASSLPESVSFTSGLMDLPILKAIQGASQEAPPVVTPETSPFLAQLLEASPIGKALAQPADALTSPSIPLARVLHNPSVAAQMSSSSLNTSLREKAASRAHSLLQTDLGKAFALATPEAIVQEQRLQHQSAMTLLPGVSAPILGQLMGTTLGTSPQGQQGLRTGFMQPPSPGIFPLIRRISPLAPPVAPGESAQVAPLLASVANTSHQHATQIAAATGAHTPPFFAPGGQGSPRVSSGALPLGRAQGIGGFPTLMGSTEPGVPQTAFSPGSSWLPPGVAQAQAGPSAGTKAGMAWPLGAAQAERSALTTLAHVGLLAPSTVVPPSGEAPAGAPSPGTNIPGLTGGLMAASPTAPTRAQAGLGAGMYAPISFPLVRAPEVHAIPALAQGAQKTLGLESAMARARTGQQTSPINASPGVSPALLPFASGTPGTSTFPRAGTGLQEGGLSLSPASLSLQAPSYIGAPASQLGGSPSASQTLLLPWGGRQLGGGTPHEWTSPSSFAESALPFASGPSASLGNSFPELLPIALGAPSTQALPPLAQAAQRAWATSTNLVEGPTLSVGTSAARDAAPFMAAARILASKPEAGRTGFPAHTESMPSPEDSSLLTGGSGHESELLSIMAASGELGKEGGARSTTSLTSSSLLLSEGMRHASYAPTQRGNTPWNMATRALGFRPLTLTTMTPSALASPQSSQGGITGKTGGIDGLLSAVSARGGIETPSIGIPSSAPASMEAPLAEAVLHLAMERTQPAGSTPKQGHAPALGFQNVDLWSAAAQSSPEQKQIATAVESIATSVGQLKESHASPTSLSRGPGASMGLALATSLGVASPQPIAHPSASFSGGVLARMEYALNQVGAERILQTNGDENPDLNLGSTSLAPFLDLAHTALSQQKAPGNITESNDAQPHTEWVHPDRQGTQNAERLERVLVSQKEAADVGVSGKATPSQTAPASTSWSNPLSMNGFPGFPSPMASAVGGAAMLSEDKGEPAAASREKAAGDGAGSKTEVDLDALALELANRIKSKLERDAERRGKWR